MTPIPAQPGTAERKPTGIPVLPLIRRGRHRKPRPRKVLLAAGGLALAAGVLSLVRVAPDSGVGAPGTAEAEPRLDQGGTTDHASGPASDTTPTTLPSATSVMGGFSPAPMSPATTTTTPQATPTTLPDSTDIPTTIPTSAPRTTAPRPSPTTPVTPTPSRAPTPTPSRTTQTPAPEQGGVCVPVIALCVDLPGARSDGQD
ncbi:MULTISPECIES: hypothetical protein [unclassified Streptomyces]|uniref:hypothetical protein n=1 Tax=unclassified Streptomyces TaxID=2593676 RepID=UPI0011AD9C0C|nr:hypothetical protein [Streptomyces sp. BK340]TVZ93505.1 hypothetical protein FB157_106227 [Streptomyces sp. BK340]